jgi:membrane associated rhomboid family serine protease
MWAIVDWAARARARLAGVERRYEQRLPRPVRLVAGLAPVTVAVIAGLGWLALEAGYTADAVAGTVLSPSNPLLVPLWMLVHAGPGHYTGNMYILVPFGVVLTWLTSNRHVLLIAVVSEYATALMYLVGGGIALGASGTAFAFVAAVLVRATGMTFGNSSVRTAMAAMAGVFAPFAVAFFLIALLAGYTNVAHMSHFTAFVFGGMIEFAAVVAAHDGDGAGLGLTFNP